MKTWMQVLTVNETTFMKKLIYVIYDYLVIILSHFHIIMMITNKGGLSHEQYS